MNCRARGYTRFPWMSQIIPQQKEEEKKKTVHILSYVMRAKLISRSENLAWRERSERSGSELPTSVAPGGKVSSHGPPGGGFTSQPTTKLDSLCSKSYMLNEQNYETRRLAGLNSWAFNGFPWHLHFYGLLRQLEEYQRNEEAGNWWTWFINYRTPVQRAEAPSHLITSETETLERSQSVSDTGLLLMIASAEFPSLLFLGRCFREL